MLLSNTKVISIDEKFYGIFNLEQARDLCTLVSSKDYTDTFMNYIDIWEISGAYSIESCKSLLTPIQRLSAEKVGKVLVKDFIQEVTNYAIDKVLTAEALSLNLALNLTDIIKEMECITWYTESI